VRAEAAFIVEGDLDAAIAPGLGTKLHRRLICDVKLLAMSSEATGHGNNGLLDNVSLD